MDSLYIVYKTINLVNGKFYVGVHKVGSSRRGYLGSGILLKKAIKKYGRDSFKRETLQTFDNRSDAFKLERELVTKEFVDESKCYNLAVGGCGGDLGEAVNFKKRGHLNWMCKIEKERTPCYGRVGKKHPLYGKTAKEYMSDSGRTRLSEKTKKRQTGSNNSAARKVIDLETGIMYDTVKEASEATGIGYSRFCALVSGRLKSTRRFQYAD